MKPLAQFTVDDVEAVVAEAKRYRKDVVAHVYGGPGAKAAIIGGARTIEHGALLSDEDLNLAAKYGTYWVPTMTTYYKRQRTDFEKRFVKRHKEAFQKALKMGVKIAFGTDVGSYPHGTSNDEFSLMVEYGMKPLEAIRSATNIAADVLRMDGQIGTLASNANADIIAVEGEPERDIEDIKNVRFVMKNGQIFRNDITGQKYPWEGVQ